MTVAKRAKAVDILSLAWLNQEAKGQQREEDKIDHREHIHHGIHDHTLAPASEDVYILWAGFAGGHPRRGAVPERM